MPRSIGRLSDHYLLNKSDKIILSGSGALKKLGQPVAIKPNQFVLGSKAQEADDLVIYNPQNGTLLFDADGRGAEKPIKLAVFSNLPVLSADNIFMADIS
jgi:Ca2+-binding RTX toxin-like protein